MVEKILWIDCETSGSSPYKNSILSIALLLEIDGEIREQFHLFMKPLPGREYLNPDALVVNGFTPEQIKTFMEPKEAKDLMEAAFLRHVNKYDKEDKFILGGYNVSFDAEFLTQLWKFFGDNYLASYINFPTPLDPLKMIRWLEWTKLIPKMSNHKLTDVAARFGLPTDGAHDAMWDIETTRTIAYKMKNMVELKTEQVP